MRTVQEIYDEYRIPPWLQLHQLRVAAVGKIVAQSMAGADVQTVIRACLLHDMGSIVKFDFSSDIGLEQFYEAKGVDYWIGIQKEFRAKYGEKEHEATDAILRELGVTDNVRILVGSSGLAKVRDILEHGSTELQILEYADQRVGLHGVLPLVERLADMKKRYSPRWGKDSYIAREQQFDTSAANVLLLEPTLQRHSSIQLANINDAVVTPLLDELRAFKI